MKTTKKKSKKKTKIKDVEDIVSPKKEKVKVAPQPKSERDIHIENIKKIAKDKKIRGVAMIKGIIAEEKAIVKDRIKNA